MPRVKYVARLLACVITATSSGGLSSSSEVTWPPERRSQGSNSSYMRGGGGGGGGSILSSRAITLTSSILMGCSVIGGLSSLSPGYGQFHRHTAQGIPDTWFHRRHHAFCDQVSCLLGGAGWSAGCWRACGKPHRMKWPWWSRKLATLQHIWLW